MNLCINHNLGMKLSPVHHKNMWVHRLKYLYNEGYTLYFRSFRSIGDETFLQAFEDTTLPFVDWTHEAHLRMAWNYIKEYGTEGAIPYIKSVSLMFFFTIKQETFFFDQV